MKKIIILLSSVSSIALYGISTTIINDTADPVVIQSKDLVTYLAAAHEYTIDHGSENIDFTLIHLCDNKPKEQLRVLQKAPMDPNSESILLEVSDILLREPESGLSKVITIEEIK